MTSSRWAWVRMPSIPVMSSSTTPGTVTPVVQPSTTGSTTGPGSVGGSGVPAITTMVAAPVAVWPWRSVTVMVTG